MPIAGSYPDPYPGPRLSSQPSDRGGMGDGSGARPVSLPGERIEHTFQLFNLPGQFNRSVD